MNRSQPHGCVLTTTQHNCRATHRLTYRPTVRAARESNEDGGRDGLGALTPSDTCRTHERSVRYATPRNRRLSCVLGAVEIQIEEEEKEEEDGASRPLPSFQEDRLGLDYTVAVLLADFWP